MSRLVLSVLACSLAVMVCPLGAADDTRQEKPIVVSYPAPSQTEQRIRAALHERTEVSFQDTPLVDAIEFLKDVHGISIVIDNAALQDAGVDSSAPVTLELSGITLRSTFNLLLRPLQLTYLVEDEVLKITTLEKANETLVTRVYPVRDLADDAEELDSVIEAVQAGCDQAGWNTTSNKSITGVKKSRSMVIRQTQRVHDEIEALLQNLREANADVADRPARIN